MSLLCSYCHKEITKEPIAAIHLGCATKVMKLITNAQQSSICGVCGGKQSRDSKRHMKTKIGITGTGCVAGQAVIKSIKCSALNDNISIIGFDYFDKTIGSYWVDKTYVLPDILTTASEQQWLNYLIDCIKKENIKIVFTSIPFELSLFAKYKNIIELEADCIVVISDINVINIANDKFLTYEFLKNNNFYYPETAINIDNITFPCIIKPRNSTGSRGFYVINNETDLKKYTNYNSNYVIQEYLSGDEYTCGVIYFENEVKECIALKRTLKNGNTDTAYFSYNVPPIIIDYVKSVANCLKPYGSCNLQLRMDSNGLPKIIDINARFSGTTYIRALFGFNEVEYILSHLLNLNCKKFKLREGIVKRYYEEIFVPR